MEHRAAARAQDQIAILSDPDDILGEVPIWVAEENALYWIDVRRPALRRRDFATGEIRDWTMPAMVGAIALRKGGGLLVALRDRVATFDLQTGLFETVAAPHAHLANLRFNDGACDRQGRFWVGSMDDVARTPIGTLYRIDQRGCVPMLEEVAVPNSLCWSPDGRTMYFADGVETAIWAWDFDTAAGEISNRRLFCRTPDGSVPDGATVDAEGFLWSAQYGGHAIRRFAPDGTCVLTIPVAVTQPTCVAFGGPEMTTLFITTARQKLAAEVLAAEPLAGTLMAVETGIRGIAEPRYLG